MKKLLLGTLFMPFYITAMEQNISKIATQLAKLIALQKGIVNTSEFTTQSKVYGKLPEQDIWIVLKSNSSLTFEFWSSQKNNPKLTAQIPNSTLFMEKKEITQQNLEQVISQQTLFTVKKITKDKNLSQK